MRNYRVRNAFTVKITPEMEAAHPEELAGCEFILYAVFEPNTNALFNTTHPKYDARGIRIDVVEASIDEETSTPDVRNNRIFINIEDDAVVVNFDQVVYDLRGREVDYTKKGVVPYAIWTGPDNREGKPAPKRGGNKNAERTDNDSQRKYNNRSGNRGRNTYAPRSYNDDIKVSGDDFGGKRSYPAKSKKELNNRNNGKSNKGKKPYKK